MVAAFSMSVTLRHLVAGSGVVVARLSPARSLSTSTWRLAQDQTRDTQLIAVDEKLLELLRELFHKTERRHPAIHLTQIRPLPLKRLKRMKQMVPVFGNFTWALYGKFLNRADPLSNIVLTFSTKEDAIAFAEKNGRSYDIEENIPKPKSKSYGANFSWNKRTRVSTK